MLELKAEKRDIFGKKTKALREEGLIPGELYGHNIENIHIGVPVDALEKVYKEAGEHSVIEVEIEGDKRTVLIHAVDTHPITHRVLSVDFYQIRMDKKTTAHIPLEFKGVSSAVDEQGGVLVKSMDEIEVVALPADLPSVIIVDISILKEFKDSIYVKDLPSTNVFEFTPDSNATVVGVSAPREEDDQDADELAPEDVIVEGKERREEKEEEEQSASKEKQ